MKYIIIDKSTKNTKMFFLKEAFSYSQIFAFRVGLET
jgi:hypothetical protein